MKKLVLIAFLLLVGQQNLQAQGNISIGATGGLFYGIADVSVAGFDVNGIKEQLGVLDGGGFYVGLLADIEAVEKIHVQPELLYANIGGESVILIPVMAKFYIDQSFNLQFGPQVDFILDVPTLVQPIVKETGFSLAVGAGYDLGNKLAVQAKYSFGISDRVDAPSFNIAGFEFNGASVKTNILQVGVVYMFN